MKVPCTYHLPGMPPPRAMLPLDGTSLRFPDPTPDEIGGVWAHLDEAASTLRSSPLEERVRRVASACAALGERGPREWREALAASAGLSLSGLDAAWEATFAPLTIETLRQALAAEHLDDARLAQAGARVPRRILHVLSGNVLAPAVQTLVRGWLLGAAQWLRPASREPLFAVCAAMALREIDAGLSACTAVLWWPHASAAEAAVLRGCDAVTVQGDDASVDAVRERVRQHQPSAVFAGYGARWSAALLSAQALNAANAAGLADDVALFDQQGCLSPTYAFVERTPRVEAWCEMLGAALADVESRMPRGPRTAEICAGLRWWHEVARWKRVSGTVRGLWEDGIRWGIASTEDPAALDATLDRHLIVVPFDSAQHLGALVGERAARLQGLAVDLSGWDDAAQTRALQALCPSRTAPPGHLQLAPPAWAQDHQPPFGSLLGGTRD